MTINLLLLLALIINPSPSETTMPPITCTIHDKTWTEVERDTRKLSNGQTRTVVTVERPDSSGYGTLRTWVTQYGGDDHATVSDCRGNTIRLPALSL